VVVPFLGNVLTFAVASFFIVVTPGPSVVFTITRALTSGRRDALLTVAGNASGVYLQVVAVAFGVGALVEHSVVAFNVLRFAGAGYLLYLGIQSIRHRDATVPETTEDVPPPSARRALVDGFVVGAANPKSVVFLAAILPEFTDRDAGNVPVQLLLLGAVFSVVAWIATSAWAIVAGTARTWLTRSPHRMSAINGFGGLVMIGLGVSMVLSGGRK
jgi:threonine/homoserine/homoserine lactone efflux protein